jgi:hypothetical protein
MSSERQAPVEDLSRSNDPGLTGLSDALVGASPGSQERAAPWSFAFHNGALAVEQEGQGSV